MKCVCLNMLFCFGKVGQHNKNCVRELVWNEQKKVDELELNLIILIFFIMLT